MYRTKIVELGDSGRGPAVSIADGYVEIGGWDNVPPPTTQVSRPYDHYGGEFCDKDNVCVLTMSEWEVLRQKILSREL